MSQQIARRYSTPTDRKYGYENSELGLSENCDEFNKKCDAEFSKNIGYGNSQCMSNLLNYGMPLIPVDLNQVTKTQLNQQCYVYNVGYGQVPIPKQNFPLNLQLFKTIECGVKTYHDHKQCPYYHSTKDRRRNTEYYSY